MDITSDWHIHSRNSCDCKNEAWRSPMAETAAAIRAMGVQDFGISDHLHTPFNLPDIVASRQEFLCLDPTPRVHFGIEVSCASQWELDEIAAGRHSNPVYGLRDGGPAGGALAIGLTDADIRALSIEYVLAGTHWSLYVPMEREAIIRDFHRQLLFMATHPLVTIVAHPWWWWGHWKDADGMYRSEPWFDDFCRIPRTMHDEFAAVVREHGKVVEINLLAMLLNEQYPERFRRQYVEYLAGLKARGVPLSIGSDCHDANVGVNYAAAANMLEEVGFTDYDFWRLPGRRSAE